MSGPREDCAWLLRMRLLSLLSRRRSRVRPGGAARRDRVRLVAVQRAWATLEVQSNAQLREAVEELRGAVAAARRDWRVGNTLVRTLALTAEAVRRTTGKRYYDVQLLGGSALARGGVVQMQTGEGKTLTTLLPAVVFALHGRGVHVATTNTYLAGRDCEELRPALELLGLTAGRLPDEHDEAAKRQAYRCDVTFGTGYDFGFDFLRDQIAARTRLREPLGTKLLARLAGRDVTATPLQRPPAFAIVDEADSVLIDEGTMPLILSGSGGAVPPRRLLERAAAVAASLEPGVDVELSPAGRRIEFTLAGWQRLHAALDRDSLPLGRPWSIYVENALRAAHFLERDVDYVIRDDAVQIVDPQTGRIHRERTWRDGLHQAVELYAGVTITPERCSDARVTRQRYFRRYGTLAGMTGTAEGVETELQTFYGLSTVVVPTHRPGQRRTDPPRYFATATARDAAIAEEVIAQRQRERPVLVGTRTIRHSRQIAELLSQRGIPHFVLNGTQDQVEAEIVAHAGRSGTVTIATNMAGRGTDIRLDDAARRAGGLHVIAAEHHRSRRVDRQLAGRAGRQGDPGSCRVFVSAEDELFRLADSGLPDRIRAACRPDGEATVDFSSPIGRLQERLEQQAYESRRQMVDRDRWLDGVLETLAAGE